MATAKRARADGDDTTATLDKLATIGTHIVDGTHPSVTFDDVYNPPPPDDEEDDGLAAMTSTNEAPHCHEDDHEFAGHADSVKAFPDVTDAITAFNHQQRDDKVALRSAIKSVTDLKQMHLDNKMPNSLKIKPSPLELPNTLNSDSTDALNMLNAEVNAATDTIARRRHLALITLRNQHAAQLKIDVDSGPYNLYVKIENALNDPLFHKMFQVQACARLITQDELGKQHIKDALANAAATKALAAAQLKEEKRLKTKELADISAATMATSPTIKMLVDIAVKARLATIKKTSSNAKPPPKNPRGGQQTKGNNEKKKTTNHKAPSSGHGGGGAQRNAKPRAADNKKPSHKDGRKQAKKK